MLQDIKSAISGVWNGASMEKIESIRVWISIAVGILTTVILARKTRRKIATRKKQKELAIQTGKVIRAKCVSYYRDDDTDEQTGIRSVTYHGTYEYTVDGKTKRYNVFSEGGLPTIYLPLYYTDSPKKVFSDYDHTDLGYNWACLVGVVVGFLTYLTRFLFY